MSMNRKVYSCFRGKATNVYLNDQSRICGETKWKLFLAVQKLMYRRSKAGTEMSILASPGSFLVLTCSVSIKQMLFLCMCLILIRDL